MDKKVDIYTKEMDLTGEVREYVEKKAERLYRFLERIDETRVDLSHVKTARESNNRFVAQVTYVAVGLFLGPRTCGRDQGIHRFGDGQDRAAD